MFYRWREYAPREHLPRRISAPRTCAPRLFAPENIRPGDYPPPENMCLQRTCAPENMCLQRLFASNSKIYLSNEVTEIILSGQTNSIRTKNLSKKSINSIEIITAITSVHIRIAIKWVKMPFLPTKSEWVPALKGKGRILLDPDGLMLKNSCSGANNLCRRMISGGT